MPTPPPDSRSPSPSASQREDASSKRSGGEAGGALARLGSGRPYMRRGMIAAMDVTVLIAALTLAYLVRLADEGFDPKYQSQLFYILPWLVVFRMLLLWWLGLYRGFTRYTGLHEVVNICVACGVGTVALALFNLLNTRIPSLGGYPLHVTGEFVLQVPIGVVVLDFLLSSWGLAGMRMSRRLVGERLIEMRATERRRVLIVGAGDEGEQVAREVLRSFRDVYQLVAFVDPNPSLKGRRIHGIPVAGSMDEIEAVAAKHDIQIVIVALPRPAPGLLRGLVDRLQSMRIEFKTVPNLGAIVRGDFQVSQLRPVEIEDLLGRPPVVVEDRSADSCLSGRRVLVTGAGGSIGSELCRQALRHGPASLTLMGRGENSLYDVLGELAGPARERGMALEIVIGDVRDAMLVGDLFGRVKPQVVLHAAAHKHVHFMEAQPAEAIKNNVMGTRLVAEAARDHGAERFIMISTDKAVRPTGIMGASKRVAEMVVAALNVDPGPTRYVSVRFGNVLGSRGSVIPLFRRQIQAGGPVTVTHEEVTRYFMTIPEAVSLVLEAANQSEGGELYLLDMGEPVRIIDLARQLIALSGLEPGIDIQIQVTGLRPGEKIHEELLTAEENRQPTEHEKIFRCRHPQLRWDELRPAIARLEGLAAAGDEAGIRRMLGELIADYQPGAAGG